MFSKEKVRKIFALAERGDPHIREAALSKLNELLEQHPELFDSDLFEKDEEVVTFELSELNWSRLSEQEFRVDKWSLCRG